MADKKNQTTEVIDEIYKRLDTRIKDLTETVKETIIPEAEGKLKKNIFVSIIVSFGVGFILGAFFVMSGSKKKKRK
ncbi:MAG: hypothetical protein MJB14_15825 [Spirochaetes bacterium]|nr:hypothetical protein [Spirochaetota bacterium]